MKKRIVLSVSDFAMPAPREGSIDSHSGLAQGQSLGIQLHKEIQAKREKLFPTYQSEVPTRFEFNCKNYIFDVRGRMDGIYRDEIFKIEEIKSAFDVNKLYRYVNNALQIHPYCLQLRTYGYIHWLKTGDTPELLLHLVSSRNKKSMDMQLDFDIKDYEIWLARRLASLVDEVKQAEKRIKSRKKASASFSFPFSKPRTGQEELIEAVKTGMESKQTLLIQAPTGLGKTMGILYPSLQEALSRGQKAVYVTPKNSQHLVALDAVKKLQHNGEKISSMTVTAKSKLCFKAQQICNSEFCEFAKDYYTKCSDNKLLEKLKKEKNLTYATFKKFGQQYEVCPFELQMDVALQVDTIICDYNYVFSPHAASNRFGKVGIGETEKPNLIVDEIHNLPARAMEYYSPLLSAVFLTSLIMQIESIIPAFREKLRLLLAESSLIIENCGTPGINNPHVIEAPIKIFKEHELKLREFLASYLESDAEILTGDIVLELCNYWFDFTAALEFVSLGENEFFTSFFPDQPAVKITCCDASAMLVANYDTYSKVIGFSATLKPFKFYSQLTGLNTKNLKTAEFVSPFPNANRKILIIPQISSKYSDRERNYPRIAEAIQKIASLKYGNYFVFFPSFEFMERVLKIYVPCSNYKVLRQSRNMSQDLMKQILEDIKHESQSHLIFAVQGGIFAEGVDYPGNMIIGAFIVGTPLPNFDWEREQMKKYYEKQYAAGFDYAYVYPAMAKSIQAAGRVIRSESDKGIIILMDTRFLEENYAKCMPQDWFDNAPAEIVSQSILHDVKLFWENSLVEDLQTL